MDTLTLDQLKNTDNANTNEDDGVIVDPNVARAQAMAKRAAEAGYKAVPDASNQRKVDPVKDLGFKSDEEVAEERMGLDGLSEALSLMDKAGERKAKEIAEFTDTLDQLGGEMTEEDYLAATGKEDYEAMLTNVPNPLNKENKEFKEQQLKRMRETLSPEELKAMGIDTEEPEKKQATKTTEEKVIPIPTKEEIETNEDEEILAEMEDTTVEIPITYAEQNKNIALTDDQPAHNVSDMIDKAEELAAEVQVDEDDIPVMPTENASYIDQDSEYDTSAIDAVKQEEFVEEYDKDAAAELATKATTVKVEDLDDMDLDKELAELDDDDNADIEGRDDNMKEKLANARKDIREKVIPIASRMNISGFSMDNRPVTIDNSVNLAKHDNRVRSARWALFSSKLPIEMQGFMGTEIDELIRLTNGNDFTSSELMKRYGIFYNHIISPKPDTVEEWLKTVSILDIKHLYGAAYKASFDGMNFLPYDCTNPRCQNGFVTDSIPFEDMVYYENDDAKAEAKKIYTSTPSEDSYKLYRTEVVPISNVYAMSFKEPSIYDAQIGPMYLDQDWYAKMEGTVAISTYVDKIFVIDGAARTLHPLAIKEFPGNPKKTLKAKILALGKVLTTLTSDQYNLISAYIEGINKTANYVEYQLPEVFCPKCKTKIEARPSTAASLLFTRHRLTSLANG